MATLDQVFGVSSKPVLSYLERADVDERFRSAVQGDKQIVVYGASKQGKTALVSKHLPYDDHISVSLTPRTTVLDIYQAILSKAGVRITSFSSQSSSTEQSASIGARVKAVLPMFGGGEAETKGTTRAGSTGEQRFEEVPINLELPQSVADLLKRMGSTKWIILENFHYLDEEAQKQFAFDLRAFQELGVRFVILGVWREQNRMIQFNGDLLDRLVEVPVEPWTEADFHKVAEKGGSALMVRFAPGLIASAISASFSSIGVFQELLKGMCLAAGITESVHGYRDIKEMDCLNTAIVQKANDYASRHQRALEAIAAGHTSGGAKSDLVPLHLPYYLVMVILNAGFDGIANGMSRTDVHERIRAIHHRGADVRASDMSNLLYGLGKLQAAKSISPPILAFDNQRRLLQVVDSTFYFFIKHADIEDIRDSITNPVTA